MIRNQKRIYEYLRSVLQDIKLDEISYLHSRFTKGLSTKKIAENRQESVEFVEKKIEDILGKIVSPLSLIPCNFSKKDLLNFIQAGNNLYHIKPRLTQTPRMKPRTGLSGDTVRERREVPSPDGKTNPISYNDSELSNADTRSDSEQVPDPLKNIWTIINRFLSQLDKREREIFEKCFGEGKTLEEVGKELGVTRERVRQIQSKNIQILKRYCKLYRISLLNDIIEYQTNALDLIDEQFIQNFPGKEKLLIAIASKIYPDLPTYKNRIDFSKPTYIMKHKKEIEYLKKILKTEGEIRFIDLRDRIYRDHGEGVIKYLLVLYSHDGFVLENKSGVVFVRISEEIFKKPREQKVKNKNSLVGRKPKIKLAKSEKIIQFKDLDNDRKKHILSDESELIKYLDENLAPKLSWEELRYHFDDEFQIVKNIIESSKRFQILQSERSGHQYAISRDFSLLNFIKILLYFSPYYQVDDDSMSNKLLILLGIEPPYYPAIINKAEGVFLINDFLMLDVLAYDENLKSKKDEIIEWLREYFYRLNNSCHLSHIREAFNEKFKLDLTVPQLKIVLEKYLNISLNKNNICIPLKHRK